MEPPRGEARQEGLIEFYGSFREMFEFFCKNTTIHGTIRLVCSSSNRMKTAFWTLLLLASFGMLYWQFGLMFRQFWAYPVVLTMSMHSEPKMFPAVTVCNLHPYRFELVSEHLEQLDQMAAESITFLYGINASAWLFRVNASKIHGNNRKIHGNNEKTRNKDGKIHENDRKIHENDRKIRIKDRKIRVNARKIRRSDRKIQESDRKIQESDRKIQDSDRKIQESDRKIHAQTLAKLNSSGFKLSHNFSLLRVSDLRAGRKHSSVGFRLCNSTGGNCFYKTFSSGMDAILEWYRFHYMNIMSQLPAIINISQHEEPIEDVVYSCQYNGEPCRPSDYDHFHHPVFGSCYTLNSKGTDPFWTATKPGIPYGLSLILRAEQKEHIPLLSTAAGVKVMIHSHNQTPFLEHEGFHIRPGIATTIGIQQDEVNRLGGNYGKCTTNGAGVAVELLYNSSYTLQACLHSCFQRWMLRECGCGYSRYPLPAGRARHCDYGAHPAWGHCFYQLYRRLRSHRLDCFQQCPKPCRESLYKVSAGTAKWPSAKSQDWVLQALRHQNGYNSSSSRKELAKVSIFYRQLRSQALHEAPLLSENLLLSSMGSQWSLWFGSSVLSVLEVLELLADALVLALLCCFRRLRATGRPPAPESSGERQEEPREGQQGAQGSGMGLPRHPELELEGFGSSRELGRE
ncbi:amiloride-sensitive sodium channel subunit delta isoform X2 [Poecile atricapillus]|uniref:amiloride-sensitive sodium channel subunit delta isoform X2 n=1 Tax=Poecile atricapillus TaxID=48891 RepID=UPI002738B5BF|nr:amiloride-sensitive sodium channel subunit delta isoform X2 [Poecile atricapillus]